MSRRQSLRRVLWGVLPLLLLVSGCDVEVGSDVVFVVPVDDDDFVVVATLVPPNSTTLGHLDFVGDVEVFRIDLPVTGTLTIQTSGDIDTLGTLLDAAGFVIAVDDDRGVERNFFISAFLPAGTYFVEVEVAGCCLIGSYFFVSRFVPF